MAILYALEPPFTSPQRVKIVYSQFLNYLAYVNNCKNAGNAEYLIFPSVLSAFGLGSDVTAPEQLRKEQIMQISKSVASDFAKKFSIPIFDLSLNIPASSYLITKDHLSEIKKLPLFNINNTILQVCVNLPIITSM